jgi:predicted SnoaL-like aldol condensation-catalyzing enzyme
MEANKKAVAEFYEFAVNKKDFDAAVTFRYVQHNPNAADGPEGLKAYIAFLRDKSPTHTETSSAFSPTATTSSSTACRLRARAVLPS